MKKEEKFDFEAFAKEAADQLRQKKPLTGKDGVFTPLIKRVIEAALEGEMDAHLEETRQENKNRRNGKSPKNLKSPLGALRFFSPRPQLQFRAKNHREAADPYK